MIRKNKGFMISAIVLAVLITTALAGTLAFAKPAAAPAGGNSVSVSGTAQVTLKPDVAYVTFGTQTSDADAAKARTANDTLMKKVLDALKAQGVDEKDIKTVDFAINPRYDANGTAVTGYDVVNSVQVKVKNLDKLGGIMDAALAAGANNASNLYFDVENREEAYNQAVVKAIDNAKQRAETLAKSAGRTLGAVTAVTESGGYNPYPMFVTRDAAMTAGAGSVPVSSGEMQISASISITYELK